MIFEKKKFRLLFFVVANILSAFIMLLLNEVLDMDESVLCNAAIFLLDILLFLMFDSKDNDGKFAAGTKNILFIVLWVLEGLVSLFALIIAIQEVSDASQVFFSASQYPTGWEHLYGVRYTSMLFVASLTMVPISVITKLWMLTMHRHHDYLPNWFMTFFSPIYAVGGFIVALLLTCLGLAATWLYAWGAFILFFIATVALIVYMVKGDLPFNVASNKRHSKDNRSVAGKSKPKPGSPEEWLEKELLRRCRDAAPYSRDHHFFHHIALQLDTSVDYGKKIVHIYLTYVFHIDQYVPSQDGSIDNYKRRIREEADKYIEGLEEETNNIARTAGSVTHDFICKYPAYAGNWSYEPHYETDSIYEGDD